MRSSHLFFISGGPTSAAVSKELKALTFLKVKTSFQSFMELY